MKLGLLIAGGVVVLVGTILTIVFTTVVRVARRKMAAMRATLEAEGIRLESGPVAATLRLRDFRAPGLYEGVGIMTTRKLVVLTGKQLAILGGRVAFHTPVGELRRWQAGLDGDRLRLVTDDPPGATGHVDLRLSVPDAARWLTTLREAGCTLIE